MMSGLAIHSVMMRVCCHTTTATITSSRRRRHLFSKRKGYNNGSNIQSAWAWPWAWAWAWGCGNLKRFLSAPPPTPLPHCFSSASSLSSITDASSAATTSTPAIPTLSGKGSYVPFSYCSFPGFIIIIFKIYLIFNIWFCGLEEDVMMGYVFGKKKATQVAHSSVFLPLFLNSHLL